MNFFDYSNILLKKTPYEYTEEFEKEFNVFMTNRLFSCDQALALIANEVNRNGFTKKMIWDLYFHGIPKTTRFIRYNAKKAKADTELKYVMEYFGINMLQARDYVVLLDKNELQKIIDFYEKRGKK